MARRVLRGNDIDGEGRNRSEAQSTFDRLLKEYFARLLVGEFSATSEERRSFELPSDTQDSRAAAPVQGLIAK
jgi:hypothetical protein